MSRFRPQMVTRRMVLLHVAIAIPLPLAAIYVGVVVPRLSREKVLATSQSCDTGAFVKAWQSWNPPIMEMNALDHKDGDSFLHRAAQFGCADIARFLIKQGIKPDIMTKDGDTPLAYAVLFKRPEVVRALVEAGSRAELICNLGMDGKGKFKSTPITTAVINGDQDSVAMLDKVYRRDGSSDCEAIDVALGYALSGQKLEIARYLVDHNYEFGPYPELVAQKLEKEGKLPTGWASSIHQKSVASRLERDARIRRAGEHAQEELKRMVRGGR